MLQVLESDAENPKLDVVLATPNGQSFEINPTTFAEISKLGLSFLNDPGLNSFTGGELIVSDEFLSSPSPNVNYTFETFDKNNPSGIRLDNGITLTEDFGNTSTISLSSSTPEVSDFNGSVRVNLTTDQFSSFLQSKNFAGVTSPGNINILNDELPVQIDPNVNFGDYVEYIPAEIPDFNGSNKFGNVNAAGVSRDQTTPGTTEANNFWSLSGDISVAQVLALPAMGVAPTQTGGIVNLVDEAANLQIGLPQFTDGQLASFNSIIVSNNKPVQIDVDTFIRLDSASQTATWSNHTGASVSGPIIVTAESDLELEQAGLLTSSGFVNQLPGSVGPNLVTQISKLQIGNVSTSNLSSLLNVEASGIEVDVSFAGGNLTADEFRDFVALGADFPANTYLVDTPAEIKDILLSTDQEIIANRNFIQGISSSNSPAAIELTWQQYVQVTAGPNGPGNVPVGNILSNVGNIEFIVSGTAAPNLKTYSKLLVKILVG